MKKDANLESFVRRLYRHAEAEHAASGGLAFRQDEFLTFALAAEVYALQQEVVALKEPK